MIYVLYWAAPALLLAGLVTGLLRATGTVTALSAIVAALMLVDVIAGEHARAAGAYCDSLADCTDPQTGALAALLAIAALVLPHILGRWLRGGIERAWARDGVHLLH
ncbi:MAG: hypothetical protein PGN13_09395 [Patulibacter minatonensis]